jgi:predicted dehydrogenase
MAGLRAGAIGRTGGGNFGHGLHTCYSDAPGVDLVALADDDEAGRAQAAADTGCANTYTDYRRMLEKEHLEIVSVCPRWVDCHDEMITAALEAGCHVYSEKPMTATPEAADRILALAESRGLKIAVAHQAAYLPQIQQIKTVIDDGRIGKVLSIRSAGKQDHRGGGEDLIVLGTHLFNLMRLFVGEVESVYGRVTVGDHGIGPEDVHEAGEPVGWIAGDRVTALYGFRNGVTATFESRQRKRRDGRPYGMEIIGERGAVAFNADASKVTFLEDDAVTPWDEGQLWPALSLDQAPLMSGNVLAIADLVEAIEEDRDPISSGAGARAALEMILGVYASQISGGTIPIPLENRKHPLEDFHKIGQAAPQTR